MCQGCDEGVGIDKSHQALSDSDELIAKVLRISEVSRIARIETNLREFFEAKWELRLNQAVKKATAMATQLKKPDQISSAVNKIMSPWSGDVSDHVRKEVARMYQLARIAGWKKATKQTTSSLTYDAPNATEEDTGEPVGADAQRTAEGTLDEKVAKGITQALPSFDLIDKDAVRAMGDNQVFWIGEHYDKNVAGSIKDVTRKSMLEAGNNRVAAGKLMSEKMRDTLSHVRTPLGFVGTSKQYFEGLAANAATVARVHGQIRSFMDIGITRYKISNPGGRRTCPVCQHIAGKTFTIQQGANQLQTDLQAKNPNDIRKSHPWMTPKQIRQVSPNPGQQKGAAGAKDSKSLSDSGQALPPYHFRCRCTVDIDPSIGSFDKLVPMVPPTTKTPFAASSALSKLGLMTPGNPTAKSLTASSNKYDALIDKADVEKAAKNLATGLRDNATFDKFIEIQLGEVVSKGKAGDALRQRMVTLLVDNWNSTSAGNALAVQLQMAAQQEFALAKSTTKHFLAKHLKEASSAKSKEHIIPGLRAFLRVQYDVTQKFLKAKKIKDVFLFRGNTFSEGKIPKNWSKFKWDAGVQKSKLEFQPLSSFSSNHAMAAEFAAAEEHAVIIGARVPSERIIGLSNVGMGGEMEAEFVVLGNAEKVDQVRVVGWKNIWKDPEKVDDIGALIGKTKAVAKHVLRSVDG